MKEKILKLFNEGKTYVEIAAQLNCSRFTVMYHCNPNRKKSISSSYLAYRKKNPLLSKMAAFFRGNARTKKGQSKFTFTLAQLKDKIGNKPTCYLTGEAIDLSKPDTYSLDHIVPVSKGGQSTLENCGLASMSVNYAKQNLSVEEFVALCKRVANYN